MGLFLISARFQGEPLTRTEFDAALIRQTGSRPDVDEFIVKGTELRVTMAFDPILVAYAEKVLSDLGGRIVHPHTNEVIDLRLPEYVRRPWLEWPWWQRVETRTHSVLALLGVSSGVPRSLARSVRRAEESRDEKLPPVAPMMPRGPYRDIDHRASRRPSAWHQVPWVHVGLASALPVAAVSSLHTKAHDFIVVLVSAALFVFVVWALPRLGYLLVRRRRTTARVHGRLMLVWFLSLVGAVAVEAVGARTTWRYSDRNTAAWAPVTADVTALVACGARRPV